MSEKDKLVELNGVTLSFGQKILDDISLTIQRGEIVTIIGPNGAGKSSLVKVIACLYMPTSGSVWIKDGITLGYVPQNLSMNPSMPLKVSRFLSLSGSPKAAYRSALDSVNASHLWSKQMTALSGGEMQRVLLARAISRSPDLLLLDEPLQGVDLLGQTELYKMISNIKNVLNCAVLMVSHDLHLVMAETDQVICLNHHICCEGKPESVSKHPEFLNLFGDNKTKGIAVYTHHHDHHHNLEGAIQSCNSSCNHD